MKKLLIATAAMAVVAGAQAQSSVTVYGGLDVSYSSVDTNNAGASTTQGDSALYSSRIGFKGTEDLGGGLKAEFALEAPLTTTDGNATGLVFSRAAWVGLTSKTLGSIKMGKMDMTYAEGLDSTVGQMGNLTNASGNLGSDQSSTIQYTTPTFAGLTAQVAYANDSTTAAGETTAGKRYTSAAVKYEAGKLVVLAGQTSKTIDASYDQKETTYGLSYDFGIAKVGAYQSVRDAASNTADDRKQTIFSVSAPVAMLGSGVTAHVAYSTSENDVAANTDLDTTKFALTKAFSKRTTGYVAYSTSDSNSSAAASKEAKGYYAGVVHTF
ncbi:MAG: porin [Polynucleobacter sp.]|nr:MAG: porin [Polynucleobacter sp.]